MFPVTKTSILGSLAHSLDDVRSLDSTEIGLLFFKVSDEWLIINSLLIEITKQISIQHCNQIHCTFK
jgi:hypothetical protein